MDYPFETKEYKDFCTFKEIHESRYIYGFDSSKLPFENLIEQNTMLFIQLLLRRSYCTYQAIDNAIACKNFIQLVLSVRSHFELTGSIGYLSNNLKNYFNGKTSIEKMDNLLGSLNLGFKPKTVEHPYESINVITMIDTADRILNEQIGSVKNILRDSYNWLSEFCHPNSLGLIFLVDKCNDRQVIFKDNVFGEKEFKILGYALISFIWFFSFYDEIYDLIRNKKNMPNIIEVSCT